jgi:hypothetical protein
VDGLTQLADGDPFVIGLANKVPDAALRTTEQQVRNLLLAIPVSRPVHLSSTLAMPGEAYQFDWRRPARCARTTMEENGGARIIGAALKG